MAKPGRGLGSLLGGPTTPRTPPGDSPLRVVPVDQITPNPRQPRRQFDEDGLAALARNMKANGLLQPVLVRQHSAGFELIAGERRWRAAKIAGLAAIPAIEQIADDDRSLELALVENVLRDDLNPIDLAHALRQLCDSAGLTHDSVAQRLGRSRAAISNAIRLLDLPATIQDMIRQNQLTAGHGRALLALDDTKRQLELARRAASKALSVRELEALAYAKPRGRPKGSQTVALKPAHIRQIEESLSARFGTKVTVREEKARHRGRILIEFYSNDDFERILQVVGLGSDLD